MAVIDHLESEVKSLSQETIHSMKKSMLSLGKRKQKYSVQYRYTYIYMYMYIYMYWQCIYSLYS